MKKIKKTYILGTLCLILAAWIAWETTKIPVRLVSNEPGPKFFPFISAGGIALFAILTMIFDGPKDTGKPYLDKAGWLRLGFILAEILVFCLAMNLIGFWISAILGLMMFFWTLKGKKKINVIFAICLSIGLASLLYFGLTRGFHIPLPSGTVWDSLGITMP